MTWRLPLSYFPQSSNCNSGSFEVEWSTVGLPHRPPQDRHSSDIATHVRRALICNTPVVIFAAINAMAAKTCFYHLKPSQEGRHGPKDYPREFINDDCEQQREVHCGSDPWTYVRCTAKTEWCPNHEEHEWLAHNDAIVIATDGACRDSGHPNAQSGLGVFFHENSNLNRAEIILDTPVHTNQRAELLAGLAALNIAIDIRSQNLDLSTSTPKQPVGPFRRLRNVVIKTDSKYLVDAMTNWIFAWRGNGFKNSRGDAVRNVDLLRELEDAVDFLNDIDVWVRFWHVPRAENGVADWLAKAGVEGWDVDLAVETYFRSLRQRL